LGSFLVAVCLGKVLLFPKPYVGSMLICLGRVWGNVENVAVPHVILCR
jgi:hypothetical protein